MRTYLITILSALAFMSCTTNNGDIGPYYGTWSMLSFTVDGEPAEDTDIGSILWEFQNNIVSITITDPYHTRYAHYGTWREYDGYLSLDFTHHDDSNQPGQGPYMAPEELKFPSNEVIELKIESQSSKGMVLSWHNASGETLVYTLKKTW